VGAAVRAEQPDRRRVTAALVVLEVSVRSAVAAATVPTARSAAVSVAMAVSPETAVSADSAVPVVVRPTAITAMAERAGRAVIPEPRATVVTAEMATARIPTAVSAAIAAIPESVVAVA